MRRIDILASASTIWFNFLVPHRFSLKLTHAAGEKRGHRHEAEVTEEEQASLEQEAEDEKAEGLSFVRF